MSILTNVFVLIHLSPTSDVKKKSFFILIPHLCVYWCPLYQSSLEKHISGWVWQRWEEETKEGRWRAAQDGQNGAAEVRWRPLEAAVLQDVGSVWHEQVEKTPQSHKSTHGAAKSNRAGSQVRGRVMHTPLLHTSQLKYLRYLKEHLLDFNHQIIFFSNIWATTVKKQTSLILSND